MRTLFGRFGSDTARREASEQSHDSLRRRYLLRRFWQSASGFWLANARPVAWLLSAALLLVIVLLIGAAYAMNAWHRAMFDGLQARDAAAVAKLSLLYFAILAVSVLLSVSQVYVRMTLQRQVARLGQQSHGRSLAQERPVLSAQPGHRRPRNPEYRIADDVRIATEAPVDFVTGVTRRSCPRRPSSSCCGPSAAPSTLNVGGIDSSTIPGFLVLAAVLYAVIASVSMMLSAAALSRSRRARTRAEAELRYVLTRLRENGESIALIRGEEEERAASTARSVTCCGMARVAIQTMKTTVVS